MSEADNIVRAFNDGYEKGKADAEAYLLHCGDTDEPQTNADRIRAMTDEELARFLYNNSDGQCPAIEHCPTPTAPQNCSDGHCWLDWLKQEAE